MSPWCTRSEKGSRATFAIEGLGLVVCVAIVLAVALIAWIVS